MSRDLSAYLEPADGRRRPSPAGTPQDFLAPPADAAWPAWHLVGGTDPLDAGELTGSEPDDGYPVLLRDWIRRDGLKCLKVKLRGDDAALGLRPAGPGRPDRRRAGGATG